MTDELVHYEVTKGIATVTLDSPHNRNALSKQLMRELRDHLAAATSEDAVRAIVLTHTGPVFCAGMDLKEAREAGGQVDAQGVNAFPTAGEHLDQPQAGRRPAGRTGPAGGIGIVAACDIAVAADSANFALTEVRIGLAPAIISVTLLPGCSPRRTRTVPHRREVRRRPRRADRPDQLHGPGGEPGRRGGRYTDMLALGSPVALAETKAMLSRERSGNLKQEFSDMLTLSSRLSPPRRPRRLRQLPGKTPRLLGPPELMRATAFRDGNGVFCRFRP